MRLPATIHVAARRIRIDAAILVSQAVQHEFGPVCKLHAQPVPARFIRGHGRGKELVIYPGLSLHLVGFTVECDGSCGQKAGQ